MYIKILGGKPYIFPIQELQISDYAIKWPL